MHAARTHAPPLGGIVYPRRVSPSTVPVFYPLSAAPFGVGWHGHILSIPSEVGEPFSLTIFLILGKNARLEPPEANTIQSFCLDRGKQKHSYTRYSTRQDTHAAAEGTAELLTNERGRLQLFHR